MKRAGLKRKKPAGLCCEKGRAKKGKKEGEREADECWQSAVPAKPLRPVIGPAPHPPTSARFVQTFHYSLVAIATETKPSRPLCYCWSLANGCPMQGWSGAGGRKGLIRVKLLRETDKAVEEEVEAASTRTPPKHLWITIFSLQTEDKMPFCSSKHCLFIL